MALRDAAGRVIAGLRATMGAIGSTLRAATPFDAPPASPGNPPPIDWGRYGPRPVDPAGAPFVPGYSNHAFRPTSPPLAFEGFSLDRLRAAAALHRQGLFLESSLASVAICGFAPMLSALEQRIAPSVSLDRQIVADGARGQRRICAGEVREMVCPQEGLEQSPYLPTTIYGTIAISQAFFRFAFLQHVDGEPDPDTGVRMRYSRPWPPWAVQYYRAHNKWVALTTERPVEIDGEHFTLITDRDEPHLYSPILSLMEEAFDGRQTKQFRAAWVRAFGSPKLVATAPPKTPVGSEQGNALYAAVQTILGPGGFGVVPNETKIETIGLSGEASGSFDEALTNVADHIGMVMIGSPLNKGQGAVYVPIPAFEGVAMRIVSADIRARDQGINSGHIRPFVAGNYGSVIARDQWPYLRTPLPDLAADGRWESAGKRQATYYEAIKKEREAGGNVDSDRVIALATLHGASPLVLAATGAKPIQLDLAPTDVAKVVRVDEARRSRNLDPIGDDRGTLTIMELEALGKAPPVAQDAPEKAPAASDRTEGAAPSDAPA